MTTIIKLRRDTAANWTTANPILASGEPGLETDTLKIKYGDGETLWGNLPYASEAITGDWSFNGSTMSIGVEGTIKTQVSTGSAPNINIELDSSQLDPVIYSFRSDGQFVIPNDGGVQYANGQPYAGSLPSSLANSTSTLTLNANGSLTLPNNALDVGLQSLDINSNEYASMSWINSNQTPDPGEQTQSQIIVGSDGTYVRSYNNGGSHEWNFTTGGDLELPTGGGISFNYGYIDQDAPNSVFRISGGNNVGIYTNEDSNSWIFGADGTVKFPTLTVDLHNGGNQTAQTLQFGDNTQQVIITGPTPVVDNNAQRLIIQGQRGNGTGEGGDVYLWGGDADTNGGDIKIYAGDADNVSTGYGGYVNIEGGSGFDNGGYASIQGGQSSNGQGAYAQLVGGYGLSGGFANIAGGQGSAGPGGAVNITGGASGNGVAEYGNVNIGAGASTWTFDNSGNLTLPSNTFTVNYANGSQVSLGGGTPSQLANSTATLTLESNGDVVFPSTAKVLNGGNNLNFQPGSGGVTQIFSDDGSLVWSFQNYNNFEIPSEGNIYSYGNLHIVVGTPSWTFGGDGNLTLPGNTFAVNYANGTQVPLGGGGGLPLSNGNSIIDIATLDGNITLDANGNIFTFGADGNLATPGNLVIGPGPGSGSSILQYDDTLQIVGEGGNGIVLMGWAANQSTPDSIAVIGMNTPYANGASNVLIAVGNNATTVNYWNFDNTGNLTIPGAIIGDTPNNDGYLNWVGNSSGDGAGYTTLNIVPDDTLTGNDQYLIIDPTAPGHIHIRAGGTQDNSYADLFLGGENSYFKVASGSSQAVSIASDSNVWTFGTDGRIDTPDGTTYWGNLIQAGTSSSVTVGSNNDNNFIQVNDSNVYINTSPDGSTQNQWVFGTDGLLTFPSANSYIDPGTSNITVQGLTGAKIQMFDGVGNVGSMLVEAGNARILVNNGAGDKIWNFGADGNLTLPDNSFSVNYANGTQVSIGGTSSSISNGTSNVSVASSGNVTVGVAGNAAIMTVTGTGANVTGYANVTGTISAGNILGNGYASFTGSFDESQASTAGMYLGYAGGTPRIMFGTGTTAQTFEIDNDGGNLRFYQPGSTKATLTSAGDLSTAGNITATGKIGYGSGSTVTQTTSRSTSVTINALSGEITLFTATMAAGAVDFFSMTNSKVGADDIIVCSTYGGSAGSYLPMAYVTGATQVIFTFRYLESYTSGSEAPKIKFIVIKAPTS